MSIMYQSPSGRSWADDDDDTWALDDWKEEIGSKLDLPVISEPVTCVPNEPFTDVSCDTSSHDVEDCVKGTSVPIRNAASEPITHNHDETITSVTHDTSTDNSAGSTTTTSEPCQNTASDIPTTPSNGPHATASSMYKPTSGRSWADEDDDDESDEPFDLDIWKDKTAALLNAPLVVEPLAPAQNAAAAHVNAYQAPDVVEFPEDYNKYSEYCPWTFMDRDLMPSAKARFYHTNRAYGTLFPKLAYPQLVYTNKTATHYFKCWRTQKVSFCAMNGVDFRDSSVVYRSTQLRHVSSNSPEDGEVEHITTPTHAKEFYGTPVVEEPKPRKSQEAVVSIPVATSEMGDGSKEELIVPSTPEISSFFESTEVEMASPLPAIFAGLPSQEHADALFNYEDQEVGATPGDIVEDEDTASPSDSSSLSSTSDEDTATSSDSSICDAEEVVNIDIIGDDTPSSVEGLTLDSVKEDEEDVTIMDTSDINDSLSLASEITSADDLEDYLDHYLEEFSDTNVGSPVDITADVRSLPNDPPPITEDPPIPTKEWSISSWMPTPSTTIGIGIAATALAIGAVHYLRRR
ncbi:hypothetical protein P280DRAFT_476355 [Massarina eburnea CBS 473.64]|uniref:Uncharacterized protein n=1 Tax=Massarina eburnea CBS 473.64 TaxID=1395130 RepID=A0A6A6SDC4_9PLEO|nr:hypothetical protein P280DRAFT_476355 [Massarina eburnea CBS 473.64]